MIRQTVRDTVFLAILFGAFIGLLAFAPVFLALALWGGVVALWALRRARKGTR